MTLTIVCGGGHEPLKHIGSRLSACLTECETCCEIELQEHLLNHR